MSEVLFIDSWMCGDCTIGRMSYGHFRCLTLELPWLLNKRNVSCIPSGNYTSVKYDSPKHGSVLLLQSVRNRSFIEIHAGNFTYQIEGCILVGDSLKYLDGDTVLDVTNSKNTLAKLLASVPNEVEVAIVRQGRNNYANK